MRDESVASVLRVGAIVVGFEVATKVGWTFGVGYWVGPCVGAFVGTPVSAADGMVVGAPVGALVGSGQKRPGADIMAPASTLAMPPAPSGKNVPSHGTALPPYIRVQPAQIPDPEPDPDPDPERRADASSALSKSAVSRSSEALGGYICPWWLIRTAVGPATQYQHPILSRF